MKLKHPLMAVIALCLVSLKTMDQKWVIEKHNGYNLIYTPADNESKGEYVALVENGMSSVKMFFNTTFSNQFDVYVHPHRRSLDSTWQKDWNMPDFKSECWMVASGTATKLDMISPVQWDKQACEHSYADTKKMQQLITHELVHVFHGQQNISPDFSNVDGIDWFVEGLATYASGQCDSVRISGVKKALSENKIPNELDKFWAGKLRYGLSGSVVMFINNKYGRQKLTELLPFNKKADILSALKTTESELLAEWKKYILDF